MQVAGPDDEQNDKEINTIWDDRARISPSTA